MKRCLLIVALSLAAAALADGDAPQPTGAAALGASQRVQIQSEVKQEKAWRRDVVMVGDNGEIIGDGGVVGEKASTDAINEVAQDAYQISVAASQSMNASMAYLYSHTNQMAQHCVQFAIHIAPESVMSNLTGYVVKTETVGNTDHQWVWYNRVLSLRPNRFVRYSRFGEETAVKANWVNWTTNGVSVTVNGRTWNGCHECTVERPACAIGETCLDLPNETWGGPNGIDWGDMLLTDGNGTPYFTGFVTNGVTGAVLYFDNGFLKNQPNN